jgi:predicted RNase H-like nuclease (RuvC/YqgF family)
MQTVASKKRKRHMQVRDLKRLRGKVKELQGEIRGLRSRVRRLQRRSRRLENIERSRWWRMRPRLPRQRRSGH